MQSRIPFAHLMESFTKSFHEKGSGAQPNGSHVVKISRSLHGDYDEAELIRN